MFGRKLAKNVVTANLATAVRGNQPTGFDPENLHDLSHLPANPFVGGRPLETAGFLQVDQIDDGLPGSQTCVQYLFVNSAGSDHYYFGVMHYLFPIRAQQGTNMGNHLLDILAIRTNK